MDDDDDDDDDDVMLLNIPHPVYRPTITSL